MESIDILNLCKRSSSPTSSENSNDPNNGNSSSNNNNHSRNSQQKRNKRVQKMRSMSEKQYAVDLYLKGLSKAEVSRQTNVPESTLRGWIKDAQTQGNMTNCSSDEDSAKNRRCVVQLPLKKRKLNPAILEEINYFGKSDDDLYFDNYDSKSLQSPLTYSPVSSPDCDPLFFLSISMGDNSSLSSTLSPVPQFDKDTSNAPQSDNDEEKMDQNDRPYGNVLQSTSTSLNGFENLQNSVAQYESMQAMNSSKRKRNSILSSGQSEIENVDPRSNNKHVPFPVYRTDETATSHGLKAKKCRRKRQLGNNPQLQTDEEKVEWVRRRQQEISMKMMESVISEQKIHVDQEPLQLVCVKMEDELRKENEIPTIEEAIKHGERFQSWLENCSHPAVSMYKIQEFRKLMNSIIASKKE